MLRIEKVYIQGFKSFCDPTEVLFDAEGITAVVGPNGCGKSNVADALSWVIGEQRAKALRGGKMEDVIFQGSRNRPAAGLAEVILTLRVVEAFALPGDERADKAPPPPSVELPREGDTASVDNDTSSSPTAPTQESPVPLALPAKSSPRAYLEGEKISIARRLYRTGESEYEMNGRNCRLRDIQELFAGTGLGAAHYAIIEQGRIGQVLSAKPLDRRALIEEAAGISKFKMRQRSAELKLDAARQNLSRVTDIILEVERQQNALKRQAAKARRFQRLRGEMRNLLKWVFVSEYRQAQQTIQQMEQQREAISQQETDLLQEVQQSEAQRLDASTQADQHQALLTDARAVAAATYLQIEKERQQQQYLGEQISAIGRRARQADQDQTGLQERQQLLGQETVRVQEALAGVEEEINLQASHLAQAEKAHAEQTTQDQQTEQQLDSAQRQVTEAATHQERWHQLVRQFTEAGERAQKNLLGLNTEQQRTATQEQTIAQDRASTAQRVEQFEIEQTVIAEQFSQAQITLNEKQATAQVQAKVLQQRQKEFLALDQRLKSLHELDERKAYFSETVQAVMQASKNANTARSFTIIGTLADFIKVSPEDEAMVEAGLREELQYLLTPSFDDALTAIDYLKQEQGGRATFLVLQTSAPANGSAYKMNANGNATDNGHEIIRLIDILGLKPDLRSIIQQALPGLSQTVVAEHLQQAIKASISTNGKGNSFLTSTGEYVSAGHIISGGSSYRAGSGILALKREIEELTQQILALSATIQEMETQSEATLQEIAHWTQQQQLLDAQQREIEKALLQQRGILTQHNREHERTLTHLRILETEIEQATEEQYEVQRKLSHAQEELAQAQSALTAAVSVAAATSESIAQIRLTAATRMQELSSRRADFAAKSERRKGLQQDLRRLSNESEEISRRLHRIQMETQEAEGQSQKLHETRLVSEESLTALLHQQQLQMGEVAALENQLEVVRESIQQFEARLVQARTLLNEARENRTEIDIERTRLLSHIEHLAANCYAELGESLTNLIGQQGNDASGTETTITEVVTAPLPIITEDTDSPEEEDADLAEPVSFTQMPDDFDLEEGKNQLASLRTRIDALGPVNLLALQELGEQEERLAFLLTQKADIEQAVTDTLSVIAELKRRSQERFRDAFYQINRNFSEMFLELFGGGHGEMRLIDESDVLESGIDIIAQPPGKRLQNVLLLSGGEKAMAALALVMGIFKYRPSPFCLLDEVDAPLDDVNIGRFADKVLEMSQRTQFMVITHSKRTMEAAKTLYGVTMEDPGVSKLISVRLT